MISHTNILTSMWTVVAAAALALSPMADDAAKENAGETIPPGEQGAKDALAKSPRHGEWVDIDIPGEETKLHTWVVYPERSDKAPVVIVIHEIFGMTDWVRSVTDQLAADGFIAVAPDLLSGMGPDGGGTESLGEQARDVIRKLSPEDTAKRLNAARQYALALPSASGKSACIGFCWGGSASFQYATQQPELDAAVVYYGTAPREASELEKIACPVMGFYGEDDSRVTSTVEATKEHMTKLKKEFAAHVYDGAGHGFLRQQNGRGGANAKAAKDAWRDTVAFLRKHTS